MSIFDVPNKFADDIERKFPRWLTWDFWGDPATWCQHGVWALLFAGVGALIGLPLGLARIGARIGSLVALTFYIVREGIGLWEQRGQPGAWWRGRPHWTGWALDGVMDCVGPALIAWWLW